MLETKGIRPLQNCVSTRIHRVPAQCTQMPHIASCPSLQGMVLAARQSINLAWDFSPFVRTPSQIAVYGQTLLPRCESPNTDSGPATVTTRLQLLEPQGPGLPRVSAGRAPAPAPRSALPQPHLIQVHVGPRALGEHLIHGRLHLGAAALRSLPASLIHFRRASEQV